MGAAALLLLLEFHHGAETFFNHDITEETCISYAVLVAGFACEPDSFRSIDRGIDVVCKSGLTGGELFNVPDDVFCCLEIVVDDGFLYAAVIAAALSGVWGTWPPRDVAANDFRLVYTVGILNR